MSISEILKTIPERERARLNTAFESGFSQMVIYKENQYVGVYVDGLPNLVVEQKAGNWSAGRIK